MRFKTSHSRRIRLGLSVVVIFILAACGGSSPENRVFTTSNERFDLSEVAQALEEGFSGEVVKGVTVDFQGLAKEAEAAAFKGPFLTPEQEDKPGGAEDKLDGADELETLDLTVFSGKDGKQFRLEVDTELIREMLTFDEEAGANLSTEEGGEDFEGAKGDFQSQHVGDNRSSRAPTTAWPWRTIGQLSNGCSGVLVGPSTVATAAHCVVSSGNFSFPDFTPARDGGSSPYGAASVRTITVPTAFVTENCSRDNWTWSCISNDVAIVLLDEDYSFNMGYWYMSWGGLKKKAIYNRGYGDCFSPDPPPSCARNRLYGAPGAGSFTSISRKGSDGWNDIGHHDMFVNPGHSGSPTYMYVDGRAVVTGVQSSYHGNARGGTAKRFGPNDTGRITFMRNLAASR